MAIARTPSSITLPACAAPCPTLPEFLAAAFPHVPAAEWAARLRDGKLRDAHGRALTPDTPYAPGLRIFYFREVEHEPVIPFREEILFRNDELLVADKPHFLPAVPGGRYVNECLEQRLRARTGIAELVVLHRLDRETAGLVLCSLNPATRHRYHRLFTERAIDKEYEALAHVAAMPATRDWLIENRIVRGTPRFRMQVVPGPVNARSQIHLLEVVEGIGRFRLHPVTGKTHQLRLHLSGLGFPIVNDRYYPELTAERPDDYTRPLQLLARRLRFRDPLTGQDREFESARVLGAQNQ